MQERYYASVSGALTLAGYSKNEPERAASMIRSGIAEHVFIENENGNRAVILFEGSSMPYSEAGVKELLDSIKGCCAEGRLEFCGEDRELWCLRYDPERGEWVRLSGHIVYEECLQT